MGTVYNDLGNASIGVSGKALHAVPTVAGEAPLQLREVQGVTTMKTVTFPTPVKEVTIKVSPTTHTSDIVHQQSQVVVAFDAPSDLVATAWLTGAEALTSDSNRVLIGNIIPETFFFAEPGITRLDMIEWNAAADVMHVFIEAA